VIPFFLVIIPAFVALCLVWVTQGRAGLDTLLQRLSWRRLRFKWIFLSISIGLAMRLAVSVLALALGWINSLTVRPLDITQAILFSGILLVAAVPEEIGWRGYALPRLLDSYHPAASSFIIGSLWGITHLVLHLDGMPYHGLPPLLTVMQVLGLSVILTWCYLCSGHSLLIPILLHASQSFFVILNDGITQEQQVWLMAVVWIATGLVVILVSSTMRPTNFFRHTRKTYQTP